MKGNEVLAEAAIRCGCDAYFGYPITPQSEVLETLAERAPWNETGMVVLQAESEIASINMVYGAAAAGKRVMTSSSSPGISLMSEGISYLAGTELPAVIVNVARGGPGLGTIQGSQCDYLQATKASGHGDFNQIVLAPYSVQETNDFVELAFELAFRYRNPVMILSDGVIGQMMEKVTLSPYKPRWTDEYIIEHHGDWALTGKKNRPRQIATSVELDPLRQEQFNQHLQRKYEKVRANEVRYEETLCDDADYVLVAYGSSARICHKVVEMCREEGLKVGLFRPITLFPFPEVPLQALSRRVKGMLAVEMSAGQLVQDVEKVAQGRIPVHHFGRMGGVVHSPEDVYQALKEKLIV
jgi:2-oxoglutarate ferredoxin oxidoreductase subunit alpha